MGWQVHELVPLAQVADVERSLGFYRKLGLVVGGRTKDANLDFAGLQTASGRTVLMLSRAQAAAAAKEQRVLFYLYTQDLKALRERLLADGLPVPPIEKREYMQRGEIELTDPDGYTILVGEDG